MEALIAVLVVVVAGCLIAAVITGGGPLSRPKVHYSRTPTRGPGGKAPRPPSRPTPPITQLSKAEITARGYPRNTVAAFEWDGPSPASQLERAAALMWETAKFERETAQLNNL